jgi:hypothetical protein
MAAHHFVVNLRTETASDTFRDALDPWGYLLPGNASRSIRETARQLTAEGVEVVADNGYFDDIARVVGQHADVADALHRRVGEQARVLGRDVRRGELAPSLRDAYRELAAAVREAAESVTADRNGTLPGQQAAGPTRLIGMEDITMAAWLALDIEPAYLEARRDMYRSLNRSVARRAGREIAELDRSARSGYYPVASALDYNSALDAGMVFAEAGLERVAMGFGAYMADDHFSDHVVVGRRRLDLGARLPMRYLRTALVARGFWTGYKAVAGRPPRAFHFLGLGAPIVLGLVALCAHGTPLLTFDATSPVKDAVEGTLYVSRPAPLKIRTRRLALQLASGERREWACPCPFCGAFAEAHPFDLDAASDWFADHPGVEPSSDDLRPGGALFEALPLMSEPAPGPLRTAVSATRVGHNHWALRRLTDALDATSHQRELLRAHLEEVVESYERHTNSPPHAAAVRFAYEVAADTLDLSS